MRQPPRLPRLPRTADDAINGSWVVKRRCELSIGREASGAEMYCCELRLLHRATTKRLPLGGYSRPGGGENVGMPGSGAITPTPRLGAAVVAGPIGTVGAAVGAATYGVAEAGAAVSTVGNGDESVGTPGAVSYVGTGTDECSTAGASGAGSAAGL